MNRSCVSRLLPATVLGLLVLGLSVRPATAQEDDEIQTADYDVTELTYPDLRDFEPPEPERIELDNGMTVFLLEDHELPQVSAVAQVGTGSVYEPDEKRGLASVTGTVMRTGGTESMSPDSVNTVLENIGATVETGIGETSGTAYMSTLADHVDTVFPVFAEVLRRPAFAQEKVQQAKSQQKSAISRRNDNASRIASREFDQILYGEDSPYARVPQYYTIDRIQRQDLVDFHDQYFHPNNVILSVWGDFETDAMIERIRTQFGDWEAPADFTPPTPPEPEATRAYSVNYVPKSDVNQSTVYMGHPGEITRRSDDYAAVRMMNEVLSGGFSSRLFQEVRREKGLAYSVGGAYTAGYNQPGRFYARTATKSASTVEATNAVLTEVRRMQEDPPTQEELDLAKDSYLNSFVFNFDTEQEVLGRRMTYEYYDYPADFLQQTREAIEEVTTDDVLAAAKQYLHPDESHILIVGNGDQFSQDLSALTNGGTVDTLDISIPREPPSEEQAPAPAADKEAMAAGQKLMAGAKEALGGSAFDQIENMRVVTEQQGNESTLVVELPDKLRTELNTPMGSITVVDNGQTMKMKTPQGTRTAPPSARGQVTGQLWRSMPYLMANLDHQELSFRAEGDTTVSGTTYRRVRVEPPSGTAYTLHLSAETMQPERLTFKQTNPRSGQTVRVMQTFSDFRETSGVMLPFKTETVQSVGDKEQTITSTIQSLEINADLEDGLFTLDSSTSSDGTSSQ